MKQDETRELQVVLIFLIFLGWKACPWTTCCWVWSKTSRFRPRIFSISRMGFTSFSPFAGPATDPATDPLDLSCWSFCSSCPLVSICFSSNSSNLRTASRRHVQAPETDESRVTLWNIAIKHGHRNSWFVRLLNIYQKCWLPTVHHSYVDSVWPPNGCNKRKWILNTYGSNALWFEDLVVRCPSALLPDLCLLLVAFYLGSSIPFLGISEMTKAASYQIRMENTRLQGGWWCLIILSISRLIYFYHCVFR